jgi:hypothetical protein
MIIKVFDNGWGPEYPAKQLENRLLRPWMNQLQLSDQQIVVINSVWYSDEFHQQQVVPFLKNNSVDRIVLVSMLDFAIPQPAQFSMYAPVTAVGYYDSPEFVDYWTLFLNETFQSPAIDSLLDSKFIKHAYMCLNRKPHWHRKKLYRRLESMQLLNHGLVSLGGDNAPATRTLKEDVAILELAPNSGTDQNGIPNDISGLGNINNWQSCLVNIVTETVYGIDQHYFVSEKIYKPILGLRPVLVYDPVGATNWLTTRGFEVYTDDFTDITDLNLANGENIPEFLKTLCNQSVQYWQHKFVLLRDKLLYNRSHFDYYANTMIKKLTNHIIK